MVESPVVIVGAGVSGLICGIELYRAGVPVLLIDKSAAVGGRIQTECVDGFLLDRGFQVLLSAYPEARRYLDYDRLDLKSFWPGAIVRYKGRFVKFVDPLKRPRDFFSTFFSPIATLMDKLRIARLNAACRRKTIEEIESQTEVSTEDFLLDFGFSPRVINSFFRPFLGGVFLENKLATSSQFFQFVFKMFGEGEAVLPAEGMNAIARQLAEQLPSGSLQLNATVQSVASDRVFLKGGAVQDAAAVVLATDVATTSRFLDLAAPDEHGVWVSYFDAQRPPLDEALLVLNGSGKGVINNLSIPSNVASSYAPEGRSLLSATVLDDQLGSLEISDEDSLANAVGEQLEEWYGPVATQWRHLKTYRIQGALPVHDLVPNKKDSVINGMFVCGDFQGIPSTNGAMKSGRLAAERVIKKLRSD